MSRLDPKLTDAKLWQTLTASTLAIMRGQASGLRISPPCKGEMTLKGWREFCTAFEMALNLVLKHSNREEKRRFS